MTLPIDIARPLGESGLALARGPDLSRYLIVCFAMLAGVALLGLCFRKLVARKLAQHAARRSLAVIDVLPLGGRRQLSVVRCYDRTFVLGLGEKEVRLVAELDPVVGADKASPPPRDADAAAFARLLESARARIDQAAKPARAERPALEEIVA